MTQRMTSPKEGPLSQIMEEVPETLMGHIEFHDGDDFETLMLSYTPWGSWTATGFGGRLIDSKTLAGVLREMASLMEAEEGVAH
jgi:hypothetical protein